MENYKNLFTQARVMITGGTGSWGNELTRQLLENGVREIVIYSRGELAQVEMQRKFGDVRIRFVIGDVRDYQQLERAMEGMNYVFHLAALKHVPVCEMYPEEAIKTNVIGTENVIRAAIANGVYKVIDVSTDKAVDPVNVYGMSKGLGEKLMIHANLNSRDTRFVCVRGGNVMGSNGSVIPHFIDTIKKHNEISITDPNMTRYFLTLGEAIGLLFKAVGCSQGGEIFVMNMPACTIEELGSALIEKYGMENTAIHVTGIRPGEKMHEVLISKNESAHAYVFDKNYFVILPYNIKFNSKLKKVEFEEFTSNTYRLTSDELKKMLEKGGF